MVNSIQAGGAAYDRLKPLLAPPLPVQGEAPYASFLPGTVVGLTQPSWRPVTETNGPLAIKLDHVTFRYPGAARAALRSVSLDVPAGAMVAVTGPVGAGKSALARSLLGLWPLETGAVYLDGELPSAWTADERAARVGYLPQDPHLFSGSVRENIALGVEVSPAGLEIASQRAGLAADVRAFPLGLDTPIGELGIRVSGGQRQRIGLARALAAAWPAQPGLLVLDDPFSAVDVATETEIINALRAAIGREAPLERRSTIVLCSHRLAAFPLADLVVVLDEGRVVELGTHPELIMSGGLYARIFHAQHQLETVGQVDA
jgi:ABC-type multidrug transport system fused ATPase/permease subunit